MPLFSIGFLDVRNTNLVVEAFDLTSWTTKRALPFAGAPQPCQRRRTRGISLGILTSFPSKENILPVFFVPFLDVISPLSSVQDAPV